MLASGDEIVVEDSDLIYVEEDLTMRDQEGTDRHWNRSQKPSHPQWWKSSEAAHRQREQ